MSHASVGRRAGGPERAAIASADPTIGAGAGPGRSTAGRRRAKIVATASDVCRLATVTAGLGEPFAAPYS